MSLAIKAASGHLEIVGGLGHRGRGVVDGYQIEVGGTFACGLQGLIVTFGTSGFGEHNVEGPV